MEKMTKILKEDRFQKGEDEIAESYPDADSAIKALTGSLKEYPVELTISEFDSISWAADDQFGLDDPRHNDEIARDVLKFAKKTGGQIYTQVDSDDDKGDGTLYSRGLRVVNRTGIYWVVKLEGYKVDNS